MLNPLAHDFLIGMSKKLFNAAIGGDREFAIATLKKIKEQIPFVLDELEREKNEQPTENAG
jgi:hypothetical protein